MEYAKWAGVEEKLLKILQNAVVKTDLEEEKQKKYFTSATEQELEQFLEGLGEGKIDHLVVVDREIKENEFSGKDFLDSDQSHIQRFKERVRERALELHQVAYRESAKVLGENHGHTQNMKRNYLYVKEELEGEGE
ncbi:MAG: hypothetical protein D6785_05770 [Planctomycetota bacterium]|nr:MAG: hypothetical protein D6785_05770 [Planctomycetota bacterium]